VYHIFKCRYESHPLNCRIEIHNKVQAEEKRKGETSFRYIFSSTHCALPLFMYLAGRAHTLIDGPRNGPYLLPGRPVRPCPARPTTATGRRMTKAPSATPMALLHPYRSSNPTIPPAVMDHRRGALRTTDSGVGGNSASMSMALARSLVHSASAAAKGSMMPGAPVAGLLALRREGRARSGGGSGSGVG
jgi:hypothetical protein